MGVLTPVLEIDKPLRDHPPDIRKQSTWYIPYKSFLNNWEEISQKGGENQEVRSYSEFRKYYPPQ